MAHVTKTIELPAAPERVWETVTDVGRWSEWQTWHAAFPDGAPSDLSLDATFREKLAMMGRAGEVSWAVKELEPPTRLTLEGPGPMGTSLRTAYTIEAIGTESRLTFEREFSGAPLVAVRKRLESAVGQQAEESLENLKGLLS